MKHARDAVSTAVEAATRALAMRGSDPAEMENPDIRWPGLAREGVWAPTRDGQRIHIAIAAASADRPAAVVRPSLRVFPGVDTDVDVVAQTTAGGVRFMVVITGPDAPTEFRFPIGLHDGLSLEKMPSGGFDIVHERFGATVGRFHAPWGCDSIFRQIRAGYELDDTTLVMSVEHQDAIYPVVADPYYAR
jgi:hypothetical protein